MYNVSLRSPHSQVRHEVFINKASDQDWFAHGKGARVREVFRLSSIQIATVPFNRLEILIRGHFCIELDRSGGVII